MSSDTEHDVGPPVLSWTSVVDTDSSQHAPASIAAVPAPPDPTPPDPTPPAPVEPEPFTLPPLDLGIAPLSLDPLPPVSGSVTADSASEPPAPVLGEFHFGLQDVTSPARPPTIAPQPPAPMPPTVPSPATSVLDSLELKIAPLDMPNLTPSGSTPTIDATPAVESVELSIDLPVIPEPVFARVARIESAAPVAPPPPPPPAPVEMPTAAPTVAPEPIAEQVIAPAPSIPGLPTDPVESDPTPTTVIPGVVERQIAPPALPGAGTGAGAAPAVALPEYQPSQIRTPQVAQVSSRAAHVPAPVESRKKQNKKQKQQSGGGGGIALFFTLLVLVGIIVGAVVFGRPYLFPDDWDPDAKPYGEAVETVRGVDIIEPLLINRQATVLYGVSMADQLLGDWEADLPMWRSLALAKGPIDTPGLQELVANWTPAYYSPDTSEVIANGDLLPGVVDGAVTEAMTLAAFDQEIGWASKLDSASLDTSALIEAIAIAESQSVSRSTSFGAAVHPERRIDVAAFLPPVLEYRINAPQAFAEFAEWGDVDIVGTSLLPPSRQPELAAGDTIITSQQQLDRTFWYMVFASYNSPTDAYTASNALVQSSLATVDRAGARCTYATFSGTDVAGTAQLTNVLQTWATIAPVEMAATTSVLPDGSLQLSSCDPGAGFESGARFGVAREIARWRTVELAAIENVNPQVGTEADRVLAVQQVRESQIALPMLDSPFDTPYADSARLARALVFTADSPLGTSVSEPVDGALGE